MSLESHCLQTCHMMKPRMKLFFSKKLILAGFSVQKTIPLPRSSALATGIMVEVKTRQQAFIQQK